MNTFASKQMASSLFDRPKTVQTSLTGSRMLDFMLMGGGAVLLWFPLYFFQTQMTWVQSLGLALPAFAFFMGYIGNYPHFMASYKLAYTQGTSFVLQNGFQLIVVPLILMLLMGLSYFFGDISIQNNGVVLFLNKILDNVGLKTRIGIYPNLRAEILGLIIVFMYFTVGWHYAKQTFGCMMVYAKMDNYILKPIERLLLRYALLSTWWVTWLYSNCSEGTYPFFNLTIHRLSLPYRWFQTSYVLVGILFVLLISMFVVKFIRERQVPSLNFLIPMATLLIWHIPLLGQSQYFGVIALFHSLQYVPFVAKVEASRYKKNDRKHPMKRLALFYGIMIFIGYLFFDLFPNVLDFSAETNQQVGLSFYIITFIAFINIHHYFIDNVLWRFKTRDVRELLFEGIR